jgi:hypothetical protein
MLAVAVVGCTPPPVVVLTVLVVRAAAVMAAGLDPQMLKMAMLTEEVAAAGSAT